MKELDDFTVEQLEELASGIGASGNPKWWPNLEKIQALAKIALAVKGAEPSHYVVTKEYADCWGLDTDRNVYVTKLDAEKHKSDHGGEITPLYSAPQPAETETGFKILPFNKRMTLLEKALAGHTPESLYAELSKYPACGPLIATQPTDNWIKCSEELPPEGYEEDGGSVSVLVWYKYKPDCGHPYGISNVFFVRKHWEKWYTHWMPLPAPPTTEK